MRRAMPFLIALFILAILPSPTQAQEEATATHTVVRFFKCNPQGTAIRMFQNTRHVAQEMVEEGKFVSYGILSHNWGDEWNVIDYINVDGLSSFFANFSEWTRRTNEAVEAMDIPEDAPAFNEICTEHKDNIYRIVSPPSDG